MVDPVVEVELEVLLVVVVLTEEVALVVVDDEWEVVELEVVEVEGDVERTKLG